MNEISPSGQVLHLTRLDLPPDLQQRKDQSGTEKSAGSGENGVRGNIDVPTTGGAENDDVPEGEDAGLEEVIK